MTRTKMFTFLSDPSHGWLRVNVRQLQFLGILNKISGCSYINGVSVYLEEDCDLQLFVDTYKKYYLKTPIINCNRQVNNPSHIRQYPSYSVDKAVTILRDKYNYKMVPSNA